MAEADGWREECWQMIKERSDLNFIFLTKRINRFYSCIPDDWGTGYENVTIGCTIENQETADSRLSIFEKLPICHKNIICQPLLESIDIEQFLHDIEAVIVGGEYGKAARKFNYDWVLSIRDQCQRKKTVFIFRQCGSYFIKDKVEYKLKYNELTKQAKKANINIENY